jgi:cobalt-zinc-cadmium efflux system protein
MGTGHTHGAGRGRHRGRLLAVLAVTAVVMVVQVVGGLVSGSLALLADSGHMLTDVASIVLALSALHFAGRPATLERTFGYYRLEILAAVANAVLLFMVALFVLVEAVQRLADPPEVRSGLMLAVAAVGLLANAVSMAVLHRDQEHSLNMRGVYLEVAADLLGSVAVIVAALAVMVTGWNGADPVASVLIGLGILPRTWHLLREAVDVLLEATPKGMDLTEVREHISTAPGVLDVHDLHAWTISSGLPVLSAHVVVDDGVLCDDRYGPLLARLHECLKGHFDVEHSTFQIEPAGHADRESARHA